MTRRREHTQTDDITATRTVTFDMRGTLNAADRAALVAALTRAQMNASFEDKIREIEDELCVIRDHHSDTPRYGSRAY